MTTRQKKQRSENVWARAETLSEESKEELNRQYWSLEENERTVEKLNQMIDVLQSIEKKDTSVKVNVESQQLYKDMPPAEVPA